MAGAVVVADTSIALPVEEVEEARVAEDERVETEVSVEDASPLPLSALSAA